MFCSVISWTQPCLLRYQTSWPSSTSAASSYTFFHFATEPRDVVTSAGQLTRIFLFWVDFKWSANIFQLSSTLHSSKEYMNSVQNVVVSTFIVSQLALDHTGILCWSFLLIWALRYISTNITPSWSKTVSMALTSDGLLMQSKSRTASSLVLSHWSWCNWASPKI